MKSLGLELLLYERYKDDITLIAEVIEGGSKLENEKIIVDEDKKVADTNKNEDDITMEVILDVAESVDGMIKFSYDVPSKHKNCKLAVLDVEVYQQTGSQQN